MKKGWGKYFLVLLAVLLALSLTPAAALAEEIDDILGPLTLDSGSVTVGDATITSLSVQDVYKRQGVTRPNTLYFSAAASISSFVLSRVASVSYTHLHYSIKNLSVGRHFMNKFLQIIWFFKNYYRDGGRPRTVLRRI